MLGLHCFMEWKNHFHSFRLWFDPCLLDEEGIGVDRDFATGPQKCAPREEPEQEVPLWSSQSLCWSGPFYGQKTNLEKQSSTCKFIQWLSSPFLLFCSHNHFCFNCLRMLVNSVLSMVFLYLCMIDHTLRIHHRLITLSLSFFVSPGRAKNGKIWTLSPPLQLFPKPWRQQPT